MTQAQQDERVSKIIFKIQAAIFPRRIRIKDIFRDYDPLRSMRVTLAQFRRALVSVNIKGLSVQEIEEVAAFFQDAPVPSGDKTNQGATKVYLPQDVNYGEFSNSIDEVFGPTLTKLEETPTAEVNFPGSQLSRGFLPRETGDREALHAVLHKVALLSKTRGIVFKYCFQDFDRSDSTSLTVPRRGGSCTVEQFLRNFPFTGDLSREELNLILARYSGEIVGRQPGAIINYQALHDDISDMDSAVQNSSLPTSLYFPHPDGTIWTGEALSVLQRITAAVVERRLRVAEYFHDFDNLRKGFCTVNQVKTVFSLLKLNVPEADIQVLCDMYCRTSDGKSVLKEQFPMFNYFKFCADVDAAFTRDELEKDPLARVGQTDGTTTLPARRNKAMLGPDEDAQIGNLEAEIASRVKERRILLRPAFEDFDPIRRGHVTKSQFARVMATCGFRLEFAQIDLLCRKYCDLGNDREFNYMEFNYTVDPRPKEEDRAMWQSLQPYAPPGVSKYYEYTGTVTPFQGKVMVPGGGGGA